MPRPISSRPEVPERPEASESRHVLRDDEVALDLPGWDLLPPAEFLHRHARK
jgi:hypothetical protein